MSPDTGGRKGGPQIASVTSVSSIYGFVRVKKDRRTDCGGRQFSCAFGATSRGAPYHANVIMFPRDKLVDLGILTTLQSCRSRFEALRGCPGTTHRGRVFNPPGRFGRSFVCLSPERHKCPGGIYFRHAEFFDFEVFIPGKRDDGEQEHQSPDREEGERDQTSDARQNVHHARDRRARHGASLGNRSGYAASFANALWGSLFVPFS